MSKDYEYLISRSESMVCLTMIRLMLRKLTDTSETVGRMHNGVILLEPTFWTCSRLMAD